MRDYKDGFLKHTNHDWNRQALLLQILIRLKLN